MGWMGIVQSGLDALIGEVGAQTTAIVAPDDKEVPGCIRVFMHARQLKPLKVTECPAIVLSHLHASGVPRIKMAELHLQHRRLDGI